MAYFTLKIKTQDRGVIYETDFLLDVFEHIVRQEVDKLVQQNKASVADSYQARIIPRYDESPGHAVEKSGLWAQDRGAERPREKKGTGLELQFEDGLVTNHSVKYFRLKIYLVDRNFIYEKNLALTELSPLINFVAELLIKKGRLRAGEDFAYEIIARDGNTPTLDLDLYKAPLSVPAAMLQGDIKLIYLSPEPASKYSEVDDTITDLITLDSEENASEVKLNERRVASYNIVETQGEARPDDLRILISQKAMQRLNEATRPSLELNAEVIGVLVGEVCRDPDTQDMFIQIDDIISAERAPAGYTYAVLDNKTLNEINDRMSREHPGKMNLGWYHTHLIKMAHVTKEQNTANLQIKTTMFFSHDDVFVHSHFFKQPWHVAIVIDPQYQQMICFQWKRGKIDVCGRWFVFKE